MTTTNKISTLKYNSDSEFVISVADTAEYDLPDVDGGSDPFSGISSDDLSVVFTNNGDAEAEVELLRSTTKDFSDSYTDVGPVSVAAGDTVSLIADERDPVRFVKAIVSFVNAPSSESELVVEFNRGGY